MVALAGFFSPLPANIYFPAIPLLAQRFHKSIDTMNQTVTVYLVLQGVSPMLWGPLSDRYGRRVVFLMCLSVLIGSSVGLALCPTNAFWLLLLLRCFQSGGGASAIALGAGVIGDIAEPKERGGYFGFFNLGPQLAPCIGPVVGGALAEGLGWRSIFWFLFIMASCCLVVVALFLPETLRTLVGNGSIPAKGISKELIPIVGRSPSKGLDTSPCLPAKKESVNPWTLFAYPDFVVLLTFTGIIYAVNYSITATISSSFAVVYPFLSETALGLCYLSTGGGMILGSTFTGKLLDWEYRRARKQVRGDVVFCIERARLRTMPAHLGLFVALTLGWGWALESRVSIAVPLVLQFLCEWTTQGFGLALTDLIPVGWTSIAILNTTMTLNIDILQSRSSGATACVSQHQARIRESSRTNRVLPDELGSMLPWCHPYLSYQSHHRDVRVWVGICAAWKHMCTAVATDDAGDA